MMRLNWILGLAAAALMATGSALWAGSSSRLAAPPLLLAPEQTEPWAGQFQPRQRPSRRGTATDPGFNNRMQPSAGLRRQTAPRQDDALQNAAVARPPRIASQFLPRLVTYAGPHDPGTIVIDTRKRFLYLVQGDGTAMRYGVGVGKPGFEWAGTHSVTRKAEWPDWRPPAEMRKRRPDLPVFVPGGPNNPLGARALYLGSTLYRIHGSNEPWSIGRAVSSGCIRMRNEDVVDLYNRVQIGTKVHVI
ncbi:L,D-transpeptidase [Roseibium sp. RKSG952]|uniref:L,D-transpeptidase n=1 Tax=Roseibium sp. RKSG952 TaxID=2529384 RepID=UPI0012BCC885|nr:L,D-transpeptidase [Roseibium sp. RKSG952]MTI00648.1 L,D-transpeptidase [Roseibium sp. RKSG952]